MRKVLLVVFVLMMLVFTLMSAGCYSYHRGVESEEPKPEEPKPEEPKPVPGQFKVNKGIKKLSLIKIDEECWVKESALSYDEHGYVWVNDYYRDGYPEKGWTGLWFKAKRTAVGFDIEAPKIIFGKATLCKLYNLSGHIKHIPVINVKFTD